MLTALLLLLISLLNRAKQFFYPFGSTFQIPSVDFAVTSSRVQNIILKVRVKVRCSGSGVWLERFVNVQASWTSVEKFALNYFTLFIKGTRHFGM